MERRKIRFDRKRRSASILLPVLVSLVLLGASGCYFDNAEELLTCFPTDVSYVDDVLPILKARCYECHDQTNAPSLGDGNNFEGYANLLEFLEESDSKFKGAVSWNGEGTPMPNEGTKLDNCSINKIVTWVDEGKLNN